MAKDTVAKKVYQQAPRIARRVGAYVDISAAGDATLWTITGGPIFVHYLFGHVTTVIGAGLCVPRIQFTPTGGGEQTPLCAAAASIAADAVNTVYVWSGAVAGALAPTAVVGRADATETAWATLGPGILLTAGLICLTNTVDAGSGVIDWYLYYTPCSDAVTVS